MGYNYTYKKLRPGERQYDDINLANQKIVKAKYVDTHFYRGNPYIEALPFASTADEIQRTYSRIPALPKSVDFFKLSPQIQEMALQKIKDFRIALPFYPEAETEFSNTLIESYSSRMPHRIDDDLVVEGVSYKVNHSLKAIHSGEATNGFAMLGLSGSGKSTAMNIILDHYPQVIIHDFPEERIVQIVYLYVTCEPNSNFNSLYESIAKAIDTALGNGNCIYQNMIARMNKGGLGAKSQKIRELIEKFSIGVIILDEIQNIDLKSTKENSLEALLTINNVTHVGLGVLGTEEAFSDLFSKERTIRRFSAYIPASRYTENKDVFANIINALFLMNVFKGNVTVDSAIIDAFYEETQGVISHAVLLYFYLVKDYIRRKENVKITPEYVHHIGKTKRKIIHDTICQYSKSTDADSISRKNIIRDMHSTKQTERKAKKEETYRVLENNAKMMPKVSAVKELQKINPEISQLIIENAVDSAIKLGLKSEKDIIKLAGEMIKAKSEEQKKEPVPDRAALKAVNKAEMLKELVGDREL